MDVEDLEAALAVPGGVLGTHLVQADDALDAAVDLQGKLGDKNDLIAAKGFSHQLPDEFIT